MIDRMAEQECPPVAAYSALTRITAALRLNRRFPVSAYFLPKGSLRATLAFFSRVLWHSRENTVLHDGVVEVFLHGCQVRVAIEHEIGEAFARQQVLPRRW